MLLSFQIFCTRNVVFSGFAADNSEIFIDDDVSGSKTLEAPERSSAHSSLSSHELAADAPGSLR